MNKTFLDGKTLPEKMLALEALVADFLKNVDPDAISGITTQIQAIQADLIKKADGAEFTLAKSDIATLTSNLDALLKTVTALSGTKNRGHFATPAELNAVANPQIDEFAWVGQAGAWDAYVYEASGWTKTGGTSTHTTGYDPAEIVAIKTAATTLTARVTAVEAAATAAATAAAKAQSTADAAAVVAAKNTAAIAALPAGGGSSVIEMTATNTPAEMFAAIKAQGISLPIDAPDNYTYAPQLFTHYDMNSNPDGATNMRIATIHITGLLPDNHDDQYDMFKAYVDATMTVAVLDSIDYTKAEIFRCKPQATTDFIGYDKDANYHSYGGFKPIVHEDPVQAGGYRPNSGTVTKSLYYNFNTGKAVSGNPDQIFTTLGEMLVEAEIDYRSQI